MQETIVICDACEMRISDNVDCFKFRVTLGKYAADNHEMDLCNDCKRAIEAELPSVIKRAGEITRAIRAQNAALKSNRNT